MPRKLAVVLFALLLIGLSWGTEVTYQGKLTDASGIAVNGDVDFILAIYTNVTGTTLVTVDTTTVTCENGLFSGVFDLTISSSVLSSPSTKLYYEISYNLGSGYNTLTPRKLITAEIKALWALNATYALTAGSALAAITALNADHAARADSADYADEANYSATAGVAAVALYADAVLAANVVYDDTITGLGDNAQDAIDNLYADMITLPDADELVKVGDLGTPDWLNEIFFAQDATNHITIADAAIGADQIANAAIGADKIANAAIGADKIADEAIGVDKFALGTEACDVFYFDGCAWLVGQLSADCVEYDGSLVATVLDDYETRLSLIEGGAGDTLVIVGSGGTPDFLNTDFFEQGVDHIVIKDKAIGIGKFADGAASDGDMFVYSSGDWTIGNAWATKVDYDNSMSGLAGATVQKAIDELAAVTKSDTIWSADAHVIDTIVAMANFKIHGELIADSIQAVGDYIDLDDNVNVWGDLKVDNEFYTDNINAIGTIIGIYDDVDIWGDVGIEGDVGIAGDLDINGIIYNLIDDTVRVDGYLYVEKELVADVIEPKHGGAGYLTIDGVLYVAGNMGVEGDMGVFGDMGVLGDMEVEGGAIFVDNVYMIQELGVGEDLHVGEDLYVGGSIYNTDIKIDEVFTDKIWSKDKDLSDTIRVMANLWVHGELIADSIQAEGDKITITDHIYITSGHDLFIGGFGLGSDDGAGIVGFDDAAVSFSAATVQKAIDNMFAIFDHDSQDIGVKIGGEDQFAAGFVKAYMDNRYFERYGGGSPPYTIADSLVTIKWHSIDGSRIAKDAILGWHILDGTVNYEDIEDEGIRTEDYRWGSIKPKKLFWGYDRPRGVPDSIGAFHIPYPPLPTYVGKFTENDIPDPLDIVGGGTKSVITVGTVLDSLISWWGGVVLTIDTIKAMNYDTIWMKGVVKIEDDLIVTEDVHIWDELFVDVIRGDEHDTIEVLNDLKVYGELIADSIQAVGEYIDLDDNVNVWGDLKVDNVLSIDTIDAIGCIIEINNNVNIWGGLYVDYDLEVDQNVFIDDGLYVDHIYADDKDTIKVHDYFMIEKELIVDDIEAFGDEILIKDDVHILKDLIVDGSIYNTDIKIDEVFTDSLWSKDGLVSDTIWTMANFYINGELIVDSIQADGDYIDMDDHVNIWGNLLVGGVVTGEMGKFGALSSNYIYVDYISGLVEDTIKVQDSYFMIENELIVDEIEAFGDEILIKDDVHILKDLIVDGSIFNTDIKIDEVFTDTIWSKDKKMSDTIWTMANLWVHGELIADSIQAEGDKITITDHVVIWGGLYVDEDLEAGQNVSIEENLYVDHIYGNYEDTIKVHEDHYFMIEKELIVDQIEASTSAEEISINDDVDIWGELYVDEDVLVNADLTVANDLIVEGTFYVDDIIGQEGKVRDTITLQNDFWVWGELIADSIQAVGDWIDLDDSVRVHGALIVDGTAYLTNLSIDTIWDKSKPDPTDTIVVMSNLKVHGELIADSIQAVSDTIHFDDDFHFFGGGEIDSFTGIGTHPARKLHVAIDDVFKDNMSYPLRLTHTTSLSPGAGIGAGIEFEAESKSGNNFVTSGIGGILENTVAGTEEGAMVFYTFDGTALPYAYAERMRLDPDGRLGIGTINPIGAYKLDVRGGVIINADASNAVFRVEGQGDPDLIVTNASTDRVGIGTDNLLSKLNISTDAGGPAPMLRLTQEIAGDASMIYESYSYSASYTVGIDDGTSDLFKISHGAIVDACDFVLDYTGHIGLGTCDLDARVNIGGVADQLDGDFVKGVNIEQTWPNSGFAATDTLVGLYIKPDFGLNTVGAPEYSLITYGDVLVHSILFIDSIAANKSDAIVFLDPVVFGSPVIAPFGIQSDTIWAGDKTYTDDTVVVFDNLKIYSELIVDQIEASALATEININDNVHVLGDLEVDGSIIVSQLDYSYLRVDSIGGWTRDTIKVQDDLWVLGELIADSIQAVEDTIFLDDDLHVDGGAYFMDSVFMNANLVVNGDLITDFSLDDAYNDDGREIFADEGPVRILDADDAEGGLDVYATYAAQDAIDAKITGTTVDVDGVTRLAVVTATYYDTSAGDGKHNLVNSELRGHLAGISPLNSYGDNIAAGASGVLLDGSGDPIVVGGLGVELNNGSGIESMTTGVYGYNLSGDLAGYFWGNVRIDGDVNITGDLGITGDVEIDGDLGIWGGYIYNPDNNNDTVYVHDYLYVEDELVTNYIEPKHGSSTVSILGYMNVYGLYVSNGAFFEDTVYMNDDLTVNHNLYVNGSIYNSDIILDEVFADTIRSKDGLVTDTVWTMANFYVNGELIADSIQAMGNYINMDDSTIFHEAVGIGDLLKLEAPLHVKTDADYNGIFVGDTLHTKYIGSAPHPMDNCLIDAQKNFGSRQANLQGMFSGIVVEPDGTDWDWNARGIVSNVYVGGTNDLIGSVMAGDFLSWHEGTGVVDDLWGSRSYAMNVTTGTITNAKGIISKVCNYDVGDIDNAYGIKTGVQNYSTGTITNAYGLYVDDISGQATTDNFAIYTEGGDWGIHNGAIYDPIDDTVYVNDYLYIERELVVDTIEAPYGKDTVWFTNNVKIDKDLIVTGDLNVTGNVISPSDSHVVYVAYGGTSTGPVVFDLLSNAVTYVTNQTPAEDNNWMIIVRPGEFDEVSNPDIEIPGFTTIRGSGLFQSQIKNVGELELSGERTLVEDLTLTEVDNVLLSSTADVPEFNSVMFWNTIVEVEMDGSAVSFIRCAFGVAAGDVGVTIDPAITASSVSFHECAFIPSGVSATSNGIYIDEAGIVGISNCVFFGMSTCIYAELTMLNVEDCKFLGFIDIGIFADYLTVFKIDDCSFIGDEDGVAIDIVDAWGEINGCSFKLVEIAVSIDELSHVVLEGNTFEIVGAGIFITGTSVEAEVIINGNVFYEMYAAVVMDYPADLFLFNNNDVTEIEDYGIWFCYALASTPSVTEWSIENNKIYSYDDGIHFEEDDALCPAEVMIFGNHIESEDGDAIDLMIAGSGFGSGTYAAIISHNILKWGGSSFAVIKNTSGAATADVSVIQNTFMNTGAGWPGSPIVSSSGVVNYNVKYNTNLDATYSD